MCLTSTPSVAPANTAAPQYMHNTYLDNTGTGNTQYAGSQNMLAGGFARQSANSSALMGNAPPNPNNPSGAGLVSPTTNPNSPRTPGVVIPTLGRPAGPVQGPMMGGVFAGAVPTNTGAK